MMLDNKKLLTDAVIMRPLAIVLLIIVHSFTIYGGGWEPPKCSVPINSYWWIAKLSYSFMLESFVFVSGYIFAYQLLVHHKKFAIKGLAINKLRRLILPSIIFSTLYLLIFHERDFNWINTPYDILCGVGHLWFLPMLFWCFVFGYFLTKLKIDDKWKLAGLLLLTLVSFVPIPFRINSACYYLLFFYLGYFTLTKRHVLEHFVNKRYIIILGLTYTITCVTFILLRMQIMALDYSNIIERAFYLSASNLLMITYASLGIFLMYISVNYMLSRIHSVPKWIIDFNGICFAVYVFHQFILKYLYYYTDLPCVVGPYWLPFIGFGLSLLTSILLAKIVTSTRVGKSLLG